MKNISNLILQSIKETLEMNGFDYKSYINNLRHIKNIELRNSGKSFSFDEHINALIFSLLSNQRPWEPIEANEKNICDIFFNFNKEKLLNTDPEYFVQRLKEIRCGNRAVSKQMESLKYNIMVFEDIEKDHGSLDNYVTSKSPYEIADELANGRYKLKQVGFALALEYLRNVGIDAIKPDTHIMRILSNERLGYSDHDVNEYEAVEILKNVSKETGYTQAYLDALLWLFCASGYGDICTSNPKCDKCKLKLYCNYENQKTL